MPFISVPVILDATVYNGFLVDHDATAQSQIQGIKENHVFALARVLVAHHLENDLEIHLLHRHFILGDGEAMVHWEISCPNPDITNGNPPSVSIDVAKVMRCPEVAGEEFHPVMWFSADKDTLIPYEYAFTAKSSCQRRVVNRASTEKLSAFAKDFSAIVWQAGLENLISLKDKSCLAGAEYVAPDIRALFRVPFSIIILQSGSGVVETGWTTLESEKESQNDSLIEFISPSPDITIPQATDGHVTQTRQTSGGTIATYHKKTRLGEFAFDPKEIAPVYTDRMWAVAESSEFGSWNAGMDSY